VDTCTHCQAASLISPKISGLSVRSRSCVRRRFCYLVSSLPPLPLYDSRFSPSLPVNALAQAPATCALSTLSPLRLHLLSALVAFSSFRAAILNIPPPNSLYIPLRQFLINPVLPFKKEEERIGELNGLLESTCNQTTP